MAEMQEKSRTDRYLDAVNIALWIAVALLVLVVAWSHFGY